MWNVEYLAVGDLEQMVPLLRVEAIEEIKGLYPEATMLDALSTMAGDSDFMYAVRKEGDLVGIGGVIDHGHIMNFWCKTNKNMERNPREVVRTSRAMSQFVFDNHGSFYSAVLNTKSNMHFCRAGGMRLIEERPEVGRLVFIRDN